MVSSYLYKIQWSILRICRSIEVLCNGHCNSRFPCCNYYYCCCVHCACVQKCMIIISMELYSQHSLHAIYHFILWWKCSFFALSPPLLQLDIFAQQNVHLKNEPNILWHAVSFLYLKKLHLPHNDIKTYQSCNTYVRLLIRHIAIGLQC